MRIEELILEGGLSREHSLWGLPLTALRSPQASSPTPCGRRSRVRSARPFHLTRTPALTIDETPRPVGWDASFNAITGLNGSGKSNILDAICFVLGITNMTSVSGGRGGPIRRVLSEADAKHLLATGSG